MNINVRSLNKNSPLICLAVLCGLLVTACEVPSNPSFETEQSFSVPLINDINYIFLGDTGAIIDTTKTDFQDLFNVDPNGLVKLGVEVDFDLGSFDDAIPNTEIEAFEINSIIDDLTPEIDGSGQTDFESITGLPANIFPAGSPIPGSTANGIPISLDMDDFRSAESGGGTLILTFKNEVGFDMDFLEFFFESNGNQVGTTLSIDNFLYNTVRSAEVSFESGEIISTPLSVVVNVSWSNQLMQNTPGELVVQNIENQDLNFISAEAVFEPQELNKEFVAVIDSDEFSFAEPSDFIELAEATISFENLKNTIDLEITQLIISFPTILTESASGMYLPEDSLVIILEGPTRIRRGSHPNNINGVSFDIALNNIRVTAPGDEIKVFVQGFTEDSSLAPQGDRARVINEGDGVTGQVILTIQDTRSATGLIKPRFISLNDSDSDDLDILDPDVRIQTEVSDLKTISERIQNLQLVNPELTIHFESNIGLENRIFAAIIGVDSQGTMIPLSGKPGTSFHVTAQDEITGLVRGGVPIPKDELIAINVEAAELTGSTQTISFNESNSNIREFLAGLPVEIFFVGKGLINPDSKRGSVITPIELETNLTMDVPISLTSEDGEPTVFSDTIEQSLSDLPDNEGDVVINEVRVFLTYSNRIPLNISMNLEFLDENDVEITKVPQNGQAPLLMLAAPVDAMGFSSDVESNVFVIELDQEQMRHLNRTEKIMLRGEILTSDNTNVSVRSSDFVLVGVKAAIKTTVKVN